MSTWVDNDHEWGSSGPDPEPQPEPVIARPTRRLDRIAARWRSRRFDRALAQGACPEQSAALALRARALTRLSRRRAMAETLRRIVRDAQDGTRPSPARIVPSRARTIAAAAELEELADALADPRPVDPHGVARAWLLLTDGTGPLYNPRSRWPLCARAAQAASLLRPWAV